MQFDINGKVALITGGASGIGLCLAKLLLQNGLKGITIADVNNGGMALSELIQEFGTDKCVYVQTDISHKDSFKRAFEITIEKFKSLDMLINNAGMCNDALWEKEISVNINGTINGVLLGLEEYIPKYKSGHEGVIINVSSIRGVDPSGDRPIYAATKFAIHGLSLAWGTQDHYNRTKVKVICVCPGSTATPLIANPVGTNLGPAYEEIRQKNAGSKTLPRQSPQECASVILEILENAKTGTVWVVEGGKKILYIMPDRFKIQDESILV
ncbi:15-hydroxyprostaglandin dehydrogenase [NAD(+)]-like isoform X1 [Sitophilus oryzae]|uniref:15-hydroxyprostaglandin dehydrogenase [NAD(+)]-like isoform X1 n=1 Tax=Sitophilus oryzae TaxID=7048 RepID=A0A6J2YKX4_SITOR|nr:15-hydroxyprostaglandin dehydrogenase [NAD(+)]-like isoform X1 [Sitophilus oryzae]